MAAPRPSSYRPSLRRRTLVVPRLILCLSFFLVAFGTSQPAEATHEPRPSWANDASLYRVQGYVLGFPTWIDWHTDFSRAGIQPGEGFEFWSSSRDGYIVDGKWECAQSENARRQEVTPLP